jgi:hypothetical protein
MRHYNVIYPYIRSLSTSGIKEMSIETLSNNKIYTLSYSSPSYLYEVYLPEVEYVIDSIKINKQDWKFLGKRDVFKFMK